MKRPDDDIVSAVARARPRVPGTNTEAFTARARQLGLPDTSRFYWYHTIDLGDGLVTPGLYDYRATLPDFHFPENMARHDGPRCRFRHRLLRLRIRAPRRPCHFHRIAFAPRSRPLPRPERGKLSAKNRAHDLSRRPGSGIHAARRFRAGALSVPARRTFSILPASASAPASSAATRPSTISPPKIPACEHGFDLIFVGDVLVHTLYPAESAGRARAALPRAAGIRADAARRPAGAPRDDVCWRRRSRGGPHFLVAAQ